LIHSSFFNFQNSLRKISLCLRVKPPIKPINEWQPHFSNHIQTSG